MTTRLLPVLCYLLAVLVAFVGAGLGAQMDAPWWQVIVFILAAFAIAYGLSRAGRGIAKRRSA